MTEPFRPHLPSHAESILRCVVPRVVPIDTALSQHVSQGYWDWQSQFDRDPQASPLQHPDFVLAEWQGVFGLTIDLRRRLATSEGGRRLGAQGKEALDQNPRLARRSKIMPMIWKAKLGSQTIRYGLYAALVSSDWPRTRKL